MSSLLRNLLFALLLAIIVWLGYTIFLSDDGLVETTALDGQASLETQEFLTKLQTLRSVQVDGSVFADPRFNALQDFRQSLPEQESGRQNPFAPVE